jgi:hypothetical protein
MSANLTQASILVGKENYQVFGVSLNVQIGIDICLDFSDKTIMESRDIQSQSAQKKSAP